jgi:hypothetical protein
MKDEDHVESCDPSPEHEQEPQLDEPDERLQVMMLARKLPNLNTMTLTLNLANLELGEGFRYFSYACEFVG